jgi:hypothetical protein
MIKNELFYWLLYLAAVPICAYMARSAGYFLAGKVLRRRLLWVLRYHADGLGIPYSRFELDTGSFFDRLAARPVNWILAVTWLLPAFGLRYLTGADIWLGLALVAAGSAWVHFYQAILSFSIRDGIKALGFLEN